ncbi:LTA synthase family protein [Enterococcus sp. LJL99]
MVRSNKKKRFNYTKLISLFFIFVFIFVGSLSYFSAKWTVDYFGNVGIEEILYTLSQPLEGSDKGQIDSFLLGPLLTSFTLTTSIMFFIYFLERGLNASKNKFLKSNKKFYLFLVTSVIFLGCGLALGADQFGFKNIKNYFFEKSTLYETYFVDPEETKITFPKKKRNLIYIFCESLETTFLSKELGGSQEENLMPKLSQLALADGVNFSNTDSLGGALQLPGVGFTVGGMVGQSSGVPLKVTGQYNENEYGATTSFMPGLTSLGDILEKEGYNQTLLIGSDASFSGRDKYYLQHGNYEIRDYNYAQKVGWIPEDYKVWWGYEDEKLFQFAQETLLELADSDEPFNLTLLTADTHFPDGYSTDDTPKLFDNQYSNVIHYSDELIGNFIAWIQEQPFYDNTTIILSGDHLSMDKNFFKDEDSNYDRTVFNLVLNAPITTSSTKNRQFSTMDLFPTTLAALDAKIEGNHLGLGTNLFSSEKTLIEQLGFDTMTEELSMGSQYYNKKIMQGSDLEVSKKQQPASTNSEEK